ncbi:hypothetical protein Tco_0069354 [Tanacetum coccineum]
MPHEPPLHSVHSLGHDEGSLSLNELMDLCTSLSKKVEVKKLEQIVKASKSRRRARIQEDVEIQEKISDDIEVVLEEEEEEPTELVEDQGSGEKGEKEVSTVDAEHTTVIPKVSTAAENLKTKKQLEQERLGHEEAVRLQEQLHEEERQRIIRDIEIAKQLQEEINKATQEQKKQEVITEADPTHVIDWSYPAVLRYHA